MSRTIKILGIESSCDETSIAVLENQKIISNVIATQDIHAQYGGVVPELASRAHQQNIIPVLYAALNRAKIKMDDIDAISYTNGPGLMGALLVGSSFAKGLALANNIPLIEVNHMKAHILAHFIDDNSDIPSFPFICLTVSGGHTQLVLVSDHYTFEIIGSTIDDAAGEAFDKAAKMLGLPYPGGPLIDKYAKMGDENAFSFNVGKLDNFNFSFSGLKTGILYFLRKEVAKDSNFIDKNINDLCASIQKVIIDSLFYQLDKLVAERGINRVAIAGGVSANSSLRRRLEEKKEWDTYIPKFEYCTDNGAMIAISGYYEYLKKNWSEFKAKPNPRMKI